MPLFDLPLDDLRRYRPERHEPDDFDAFWQRTLAEVRRHPIDAQFAPVETGLITIDTFEVSFAGWNGERVRGWLQLPRGRSAPLPCVVEYIGYGGGRGFPTEHLLYASTGYAHFIMDNRGQAGAETGDAHGLGSPHVEGFMTDGVLSPDTFYYRRLISDVVRGVEAARAHDQVDPARVVVAGISQGGGLTLAAAGLIPDVLGAMADVPYLCHYRRAADIITTGTFGYGEIATFCARRPQHVETVFATLSYFDGMNFAARASSPALFSVGLMDDICPPSTVFAAFNHYDGPKDISEWPFNRHEGGGHLQAQRRLRFLAEITS